jgi:hypothetical protein
MITIQLTVERWSAEIVTAGSIAEAAPAHGSSFPMAARIVTKGVVEYGGQIVRLRRWTG